MSPVRWGVLGGARIALRRVLPALAGSDACRVVAVAARDPGRAAALAAAAPGARCCAAYEDVLADPEVEAVYIPLANHLHAPWIRASLEAGRHVLCEKPLVLEAREARALSELALARGLRLGEAVMARHLPHWRLAGGLIAEGRIGRPAAAHAFFTYPAPAEGNYRLDAAAGGGAAWDVAGYCLLAGALAFGEAPVRALAVSRRSGEVDALTAALFDYPGGGLLSVTAAMGLARDQGLILLGSEGRLEIDTPFTPDAAQPGRVRVLGGETGGPEIFTTEPCDPYRAEFDAFAGWVRGAGPFPSGADEAVRSVAAVAALLESARTGRAEPIETGEGGR